MAQQASVERMLGILIGKIEGIERSIVRGDEHRAVVHRRLDELVNEVGEIHTKVEVMDGTLNDTKAVTDEVKRWKLMGLGALGVTGIAASALTALVGAYWSDIWRFFRGL